MGDLFGCVCAVAGDDTGGDQAGAEDRRDGCAERRQTHARQGDAAVRRDGNLHRNDGFDGDFSAAAGHRIIGIMIGGTLIYILRVIDDLKTCLPR